ncbi:MAG: helix-turn-helix transcriptional regulator [Ktedonobacteraceae bacterium]
MSGWQSHHQYLITRRLERAQHLLLHTDRSVTEICFALGFESLGSFSWLFRQRIGCSPTTYRT